MTSVWAELKRRNVVKVAVAYAIVGWILIEISATVFPIVQLPEWTVTFVTMLVLLGFPVALILSWAYEMTPDGLKREHEVVRSESITHVTRRKLDFAIIALMAVGIAFLVFDNYVLVDDPELATAESETQPMPASGSAEVETEKSIAVLAFVNMSGDPEQEYFSDGIAEEILNGLVQVPDLRVAARTSAFSFKGQNIDIRQVGETLSVNYVLEGSVRKAGDRLRITAQLISVEDGYHLWSETFDRQIDDIFAIQEEIARAVVDSLEVTLGIANQTTLVQPGTTDTEAYNWFLRGNYYIGQQSSGAFEKAIESYSKAIEIDPGFAGGHGGLAYGLAYASVFYPYSQVAERVRAAYRRALEIDEYQTQALLAKVVDVVVSDHNYMEAEQALQKALQRGVNKTLVVDAYWWIILQTQRRFDDALEQLSIAEEADPLSPLVKQGFGAILSNSGENQAALPYLETALELNPNDFFATWQLSLTLIRLGQLDEAEAVIQQLETLTGVDAFSMNSRAELYIARGDEVSARGMLKQMIALHDAGNEQPALVPFIGIVFGLLGEVEEAINWFERGAATPSPLGTLLPIVWFYDHPAIWNHPRYQALMEKTNLDDASVATAKAAVASQ